MKYVVLANLPGFLTYYFNSEASDKVTDAVFQMKAKKWLILINSFIYRNDKIESVPLTNKPVIFNVEI